MSDLPPQQLGKLDPSKRITFVHQSANCGVLTTEKKDEHKIEGITGDEAKSFYESLLNEPSTSAQIKEEIIEDEVQPECSQLRKKKRNRNFPELNISDKNAFLKAAQDGDLKVLEDYLQKGMPIDIMDDFFWTPLMIAAVAGHESTCRYLLSKGANYNLVNTKDQTVWDVLDEQKNDYLIEKLINFINEQDSEDSTSVEIADDVFCSVCQLRYSGLEMDHLTSVLHIYNAGKRGITHSGIMIPESNIGYKLLKKKGWTEEQGLGKQGEGHKFPVRTILKRNRTGFGLEKVKAKVTHFRPHDIRAIQHEKKEAPKRNWKKEMKQKQAKETQIARSFRGAFNYDDSVAEYLGL